MTKDYNRAADLSTFGYRELDMAGDLLKAYAANGCDFLIDGVHVEMNSSSGYVYLIDDDFNVGIMEGGKLVQFFSCPECGYEGTQADADEEPASGDGEIKDFVKWEGFCSNNCFNKNQ